MPEPASSEPSWRDLDAAALSRAYDNSGAVADSAARLSDWRARSADFRASHPAAVEIAYGPGPRQRIDLFACGRRAAPQFVFVHGGYWQRNAKEDFSCMARGPLALGLDVALVGYTLAPEATLTQIVGEIRSALRLLRARDAEAGPRRRFVVSGWSAGGHLAALASALPEVDAALAISGIFDLEPIRHTALNAALRLTEAETGTLSPIKEIGDRQVALVVAFGADELPELRRQSRDFHAARAAHGLPGRLLAIEGENHFSILDALANPAGILALAAAELAGA